MKNYHDIKEKEFWITKDYSEERFNKMISQKILDLYDEI
jgi:hypothetical protein